MSDFAYEFLAQDTSGLQSLLAVPILSAAGDVLGVLSLENKVGDEPFDAEDEIQLVRLAGQVADTVEAIARMESFERWHRKGLEDDLHDLIGWYHAGVYANIESLKSYLETGETEKAFELLPLLLRRAHSTVNELKALHMAVVTPYLEAKTFSEGLRQLADAWANRPGHVINIEVSCPHDLVISSELHGRLLRLVSNALANAVVHSGVLDDHSVRVGITASLGGNGLHLRVYDRGKGFRSLIPGYGIKRMQDLLRQIASSGYACSELQFTSNAIRGTNVDLWVALEKTNETENPCFTG